RADGALHLGGNGDRLAVGAGGIDRQGVVAVRPGDAVIALAVPGKALVAGGERYGSGQGDLTGRAGDGDGTGGRRGRREAPRRRAAGRLVQRRGVAVDSDVGADQLQRLQRFRTLLHRDQRLQVRVHVDLLLDGRELDQLLGELIGVERIERILVLQLRGQEFQEGIEIAGQLLRSDDAGGLRGAGG